MDETETPEARIADLEAELRQRDAKIKELRDELEQAVELVDQMREHSEEVNALIDSWIEVFDMHQDSTGVWQFDGRQTDLWEQHKQLTEAHAKLVREWNSFVPRYNRVVAPRPPGRPLAASAAQVKDVRRRRAAGASLRKIAADTGLGLRTVRSILAGAERSAELRKREFDRLRAADFRARKRRRDQLPKQITEARERGEALVKAAKGLGHGR